MVPPVDLDDEADLPADIEVVAAATPFDHDLSLRRRQPPGPAQGREVELPERLGAVDDVVDEPRDEGTTSPTHVPLMGLLQVLAGHDALLDRHHQEQGRLTIADGPLRRAQGGQCRSGPWQAGRHVVVAQSARKLVHRHAFDVRSPFQLVHRDVHDLVVQPAQPCGLQGAHPVDEGTAAHLVDRSPAQAARIDRPAVGHHRPSAAQCPPAIAHEPGHDVAVQAEVRRLAPAQHSPGVEGGFLGSGHLRERRCSQHAHRIDRTSPPDGSLGPTVDEVRPSDPDVDSG
ncbi:hypothetical protein ACTHQ1_11275 [Janibacter anophelis]|uniref:hypothetical protein n=1 Tax=Janibacter anophelis TaxID=319054 RepID=UPI003F7E6E1C